MGRKLISMLLIAWILLAMPAAAFAEELDLDRTGSISVTLMHPEDKIPIEGAELSLYYVAKVKNSNGTHVRYTFTDAFARCGRELDDPALARALDSFVEDHAAPVAKRVTNETGKAVFDDLPLGLYFVKQTNEVEGYAPCSSFLVTVPNYDNDDFFYHVNASPKTDIARLTSITIRKVWNTDETIEIADSVTVQLLRDGIVIETAVLNQENDWQVTYEELPESDGYSIVEVDVPDGFLATYSQSGYVFTVTNSASLIQTGQLLWPIPVLALAGMLLITVGTVALRKTRDENA